MNIERLAGLLLILLGIILIVCPLFSSAVISIIIGFSLVCFGMAAMAMGFLFADELNSVFSYLSIIIGIISFLFGILFMFFLNALAFLTTLQFYIVGIMMMAYGLVGIIYLKDKTSIICSAIMLILGIVTIVVAAFLASQPVLIAVLIGVALMVDGVFALVIGSSRSLIEKYG